MRFWRTRASSEKLQEVAIRHSAQHQAEISTRDLEIQAEKMLEQASILRAAGQPDIADQIMVQRERLLGAIAALRSVNNFESSACP